MSQMGVQGSKLCLSLREGADQIFDRYSPYGGDGLRNHCHRIATFATMLMSRDRIPMPEDVVYLLAMLHDLGLVSEEDEGEHYMLRSWSLFSREASALGLEFTEALPEATLKECILLNHRLLPVAGASRAAEAFRQAVWIEHTRGVKRFGLTKHEVKSVFERYPRDNFDRVMADFFRRTLTQEPRSVIDGIFF